MLLYGNNNTTYTFKAQIFSNKYLMQLLSDYPKTVSVRFYFSYTSPAVGQIILQRDHTAIPRKPEKQAQTCTKLKKARFQYITVHIKADVYYSFLDFPDIWFDFHFQFRDINNVASCLGMQLNKA